MNHNIFTIRDIEDLVKPIAEKYKVKEIYLLGSYGGMTYELAPITLRRYMDASSLSDQNGLSLVYILNAIYPCKRYLRKRD